MYGLMKIERVHRKRDVAVVVEVKKIANDLRELQNVNFIAMKLDETVADLRLTLANFAEAVAGMNLAVANVLKVADLSSAVATLQKVSGRLASSRSPR